MSDAVGTERLSKIVGYKLTKGNFNQQTPNLPQRIAIIGEANEANQASLDLTPKEITSAQQAGLLYGFGSPIHIMMRILRPQSGGGVGGVPVIVYPQAKASGAVAKVYEITPTGTATGNGTHTIKIGGREGLDGVFYSINIEQGDVPATITAKIEDAINNVLGCPFMGDSTATEATLTAKWNGLTSNGLTVSVDTGDDDLGLTYVVESTVAGSGTPTIATALALFENEWNTQVLNSYGTVTTIMDALEAFNGKPDPTNPTGRYQGIVMKPFIALTGSVVADPSSITDSRKDEVTIAICPAPNSPGLPMEAAANMAVLFAKQAQDNPHLDVSSQSYPDMPVPTGTIGVMADYSERDSIVKKGCSTVDKVNNKYVVMDFVTTYHPVGETPAQFSWCRNLNIDFNMRFGFYNLEQIHVVDHAIADDNDVVSVDKVVKPKQWRQILYDYYEAQAKKALIVQPAFSEASTTVGIGASNPDRLETFFRYKRSGYARISSTTAEAGFNFGTLN